MDGGGSNFWFFKSLDNNEIYILQTNVSFFFVYRNWPFSAKSVPPILSQFFSTKTSVANFTNLCFCTQSLHFFSFCPQSLHFFFVCPQSLQFFLVCKNFAKFVFYFWALSIFLFRVQVCLNGYIAFFYVGWSTETFIPLLKRVLRGYQYLKSLSQNTSAKTVNLEPASASTV